jgi:hypothetical protein
MANLPSEDRMPRLVKRLALLITAAGLLTACSGSGGSASGAVEAYLEAIVSGDSTQAVNVSCSAAEAQAQTEAASFASVEASLEGLACQEAGTQGEATLVTCTGKFVAVYNGENTEISLEGRTYQVIQEDGEWRVCGYAQQ